MAEIRIVSTPASGKPQIGVYSGAPGQVSSANITSAPGKKGDQGIQGVQGIQGLKGDKGDKGDIGGVYEHNQSAVSNLWTITHNLGYNPNVTIVDSANTIIEAEIWYNNTNSLEVRLSHGMSGKAYIS